MSKVEKISSPHFSSEDQLNIDCMVKFDTLPMEVPFTASVNDSESHGREIYARIMSGTYGDILPYVPPIIVERPVAKEQPKSNGVQEL